MDKLRGPDCPKCKGPAYTWYTKEFYRCRPCGHKFGPALEKVWADVREERRKEDNLNWKKRSPDGIAPGNELCSQCPKVTPHPGILCRTCFEEAEDSRYTKHLFDSRYEHPDDAEEAYEDYDDYDDYVACQKEREGNK